MSRMCKQNSYFYVHLFLKVSTLSDKSLEQLFGLQETQARLADAEAKFENGRYNIIIIIIIIIIFFKFIF